MKRFYAAVTIDEADGETGGGWRVLLDGRAIRTAGGRPQIVPTRALAQAMAAEWALQGEVIDPTAFFHRDLADYALDIIAADKHAAIGAMLRFAETDTLCYRADPEDALHARQSEVWEPLLVAAERRWDVRFVRVAGVIHQPQPPATLARLKAVLAARGDCDLAALRSLASLAASLLIAFAAIAPGADAEALWNAANFEEDWQAELWGKDAEAEALRARRYADFAAAARFAGLAREG